MTVLAFVPHDCQAKQRRDSKCKCSFDSTPASAASMTRAIRSSFLLDDRNTETSHLDALAAAQAEHDRVREAAICVYELHELREEHQRILDKERRRQERLKAEAGIAAEEKRLQELRAKSIPKPAPPAAPEPPNQVEPPPSEAPAAKPPPEAKRSSAAAPASTGPKTQSSNASAISPNGLFANQIKPAASSPLNLQFRQQSISQEAAAPKSNAPTPQAKVALPASSTTQMQTKAQAPTAKPAVDRFIQIHRELKTLRKDLMALSKAPGSPLKGKVGTFRREIRVAIGQLTSGKGANLQPINRIMAILKEAVEGQIASPPVEVSRFMAEPRPSAEGITSRDVGLPSLFVYLINICAKGIISQFINECGANPKAADPIGVFTAQLFSHKDFQWQGQSLIDILLAKFRVVCPVLFGFRGNDKTERGRQAIGWRKDGPSWITEQNHNDRMAGLGAGFAAVSLRDFSKSSKENPYPPTHYWRAFAGIVNSPPNETSNTQYVVLRSMIEGHEQRFLDFYGNAAVAALRLALVEFPKRAPEHASAAGTLRALAEVLRTEGGLNLA
ncbi:hypothetical protein G6O67_002926 [Ophiocordyceps sinensis]|uniref:mRNA export factor GLE1 n=1 Tax=Ophiocordyceps sinensis TaxID=72228 RepID=A0A8H4PVM5_9HYPO|nr:hypothetical protein G6O67_002926 [Ophiocordyceps sinensis]